jgi:pimeloyl-ACP methyl ester carboxylesterase
VNGLVDIGGYRLDLQVTGEGSPVVVCLSSLGGAHEQWSRLMPLLSDATAVVTYGRPTLGGSDPLPEHLREVRGAAWSAEQLRTLLDAAGITPPYVLVTCSLGSYIADQYAALWPGEVAGLVLIDPSPPRDYPGVEREGDIYDDDEEGSGGGLHFHRHLIFAEQAERVAENRDGRFVVLSAAVGRWLRNEARAWHQPLTLAEVDERWVVMQREWAQRLRAVHVGSDHAGHFVQFEHPELVALVVREVVNAARIGRPAEFDAEALAAVMGTLRAAADDQSGEVT